LGELADTKRTLAQKEKEMSATSGKVAKIRTDSTERN